MFLSKWKPMDACRRLRFVSWLGVSPVSFHYCPKVDERNDDEQTNTHFAIAHLQQKRDKKDTADILQCAFPFQLMASNWGTIEQRSSIQKCLAVQGKGRVIGFQELRRSPGVPCRFLLKQGTLETNPEGGSWFHWGSRIQRIGHFKRISAKRPGRIPSKWSRTLLRSKPTA